MARTSEQEVLNILDTTVSNIAPFIRAANAYMDEVFSGSTLSYELLREIETWLAAHFTTVRDPGGGSVVVERVGDALYRHSEKGFGEGLLSSRYGQVAMMLDISGRLAEEASNKPKARFTVVKAPSGVSD